MTQSFDSVAFYAAYPEKVMARPGYPARAAFKSLLLWQRYSRWLQQQMPGISTYADIGGCFGFGANAMAYAIGQSQGVVPTTFVFELAAGFTDIGSTLFPRIRFSTTDFTRWSGEPRCFDLVTLLDVIEHVMNPEKFLSEVAARSRYLLLKTPMETSGEWFGSVPPSQSGVSHPDGHVNFFAPSDYEALLARSGMEILTAMLLPTIVPPGADQILTPETKPASLRELTSRPALGVSALLTCLSRRHIISWKLIRRIVGGGDHICLCRSSRCDC